MKAYRALLILATVFGCNAELHLPADFKLCNVSDITHRNDCLREAVQDAMLKLEKGIPELQFPSSQPIIIPSMTIGEGAGTVHVVQKYSNVKLYNLARAKLTQISSEYNENGFSMTADLLYDEVLLEADYDFNGRILVLPITGNGKCTINLKGLDSAISLKAEKFEKKGVTYLDVKEFTVALKPKKVEYDFQNLFEGDERLGKEMNNLLNDNWKDVFDDVKSGYEEVIAALLKNLSNLIFKKVPAKNIFLQ